MSSPTTEEVVEARAPWSYVVPAGSTLRIVDLEGNQAVDCLLYNASNTIERYSAADTVTAQNNAYLVSGSKLLSCEGNLMMTIVDTNVERHDTVAGACSRESNTLRYGHHTFAQHACVENFIHDHTTRGMGKRDMVPNINFFMNVPIEQDGTLGIVDGISGPGKFVELLAAMDTLVAVSNCPQINNPCNGFNPSAVKMIVSSPE